MASSRFSRSSDSEPAPLGTWGELGARAVGLSTRGGPKETHDPAPLEQWFATWKSPIVSEPGDLTIAVGGDVAYAFGLQHMTGKKKGGPEADLWFRATACFRREAGRWRITHMHNSVPFAMDGSDKALLDLKP